KGNLRFRMAQLSDLNRLLGSALQGSVGGTVALTSSGAQAEIDAKDIVAGGITTNAQVKASGTVDALDIRLAAQSPAVAGGPATVEAAARLNATAKELHVASLDARYHDQDIKLLSPTRLSFADGFSIEALKIGAQEAVLQVDGRVSPELNLKASLDQLK